MLDTRFWSLATRYWLLDSGYSILDAGFWMPDTGSWSLGNRSQVLGSTLRVKDKKSIKYPKSLFRSDRPFFWLAAGLIRLRRNT
jgi:hypothetical protein